jgi:hypothetical protein
MTDSFLDTATILVTKYWQPSTLTDWVAQNQTWMNLTTGYANYW